MLIYDTATTIWQLLLSSDIYTSGARCYVNCISAGECFVRVYECLINCLSTCRRAGLWFAGRPPLHRRRLHELAAVSIMVADVRSFTSGAVMSSSTSCRGANVPANGGGDYGYTATVSIFRNDDEMYRLEGTPRVHTSEKRQKILSVKLCDLVRSD